MGRIRGICFTSDERPFEADSAIRSLYIVIAGVQQIRNWKAIVHGHECASLPVVRLVQADRQVHLNSHRISINQYNHVHKRFTREGLCHVFSMLVTCIGSSASCRIRGASPDVLIVI